MSKVFSRAFYNSQAWKRCRAAYIKKEPLCEECLKSGIVKPAEIVHHKIELTPTNIHAPDIALGFDNLQSVCRECHLAIHEHGQKGGCDKKRYVVDDFGNIVFCELDT